MVPRLLPPGCIWSGPWAVSCYSVGCITLQTVGMEAMLSVLFVLVLVSVMIQDHTSLKANTSFAKLTGIHFQAYSQKKTR